MGSRGWNRCRGWDEEEAIGQLIKIMSATESSREALVRKERRRSTSGWQK